MNEKLFNKQVDRNMAGIWLEKQGVLSEAIELYEKNISEGFEGNHPYDRLAIIYHKLNKIDDEIRVLTRAISVFEKIYSGRADRDPKLIKFQERLAKIQKSQRK